MTSDEGHRLLNRLKEGTAFEYQQITAALIATGDLDGGMAQGMRSTGMDQPLQAKTRFCGSMVAGNQGSDTQSAWPGWSRYLDCGHEQAKK
jgi:hypothetical protein